MTTLAELVAIPPIATHGVEAGFVYGAGVWKHVLEVADPAEGSAVSWYDITAFFSGYDYSRGADDYGGRYRSSVATIDLFADDDRLAPWNDYNMLGIELGPGLLIRSAFIRVDGGAVVEWNARFTNKVESWGDASYSKGRVRRHTIVARDTLTSLVDVPIPARPEENWTLHLIHLIGDSGWPYGQTVFGAQFTAGGAPIKLLPARPASASAITELDAILDPVGLIWYTNQRGQLIIRPPVYDTFHAAAFAAGASGGPWTDPEPVVFRWDACMDDAPKTLPAAAYAVDTNSVNPFGLDKSELSVINHVVISTPENGSITEALYDDDNPISIQRYDRKTMQASWIAPNNTTAGDLLAFRSFATVEARPLTTTMEMAGFHDGPAHLEFAEPITIVHRNRADGPEVTATGFMRGYRERILPRGCDTSWSLEITVDVGTVVSVDAPVPTTGLLPVESLAMTVQTDTTASFTWSNPAQTIEPTNTQIRMLDATSSWDTVAYPLGSASWAHLHPSSGYQFEVRLIRIVDGVVTHFSPIRSLPFYTLDPASAHVDEDDGTLHVLFPPPDAACSLGWELEQSATGVAPWTVIDSGLEPSGSLDYDTATLDPNQWYRFQSWEVCAGVAHPRHPPSNPFVTACVPISRFGIPPYDDADLIAYWPEICPPDVITESVSNALMPLGNAFDRVGFDDDGNLIMWSFGAGTIGGGSSPVTPLSGDDLTIACRVMIGERPVSERTLFQFAGLRISISPFGSGTGFLVSGHHSFVGSGFVTTILGTTTLAINTVYDFVLTNNVSAEELTLFINGDREGSSVSAGARASSPFSIQLPASSWITDCAVWERVLADTEIPGIPPAPDPSVALLLYDLRTHTTGVLVNQGTLGSAFDLTDDGGGNWSKTVTGQVMATFGGPPSVAPWTFMFKAAPGLVKTNLANGLMRLQKTGSLAQFFEGIAALSNSPSYVRGHSDLPVAALEMDIVYSQATPSASFPGALFFVVVDFANPTAPPGLQVWRNNVDETTGTLITTLHYGLTETTVNIDSVFASGVQPKIEFHSQSPALGLTGMAMFRGVLSSADRAAWAEYWGMTPISGYDTAAMAVGSIWYSTLGKMT